METFLKILIKIMTALVAVGFMILTALSMIHGMPVLLTVVSAMLGSVSGFMTYLDIKNFLKARKQ